MAAAGAVVLTRRARAATRVQFSGEVCREFTNLRYNARARRYDQVRRDVWSAVHGWHDSGDRRYNFNHEDMQVYAAHTYRRAYVDAIKGPVTHRARPLAASSALLDGRDRDLEQFAIPVAFGWGMCQARLAELEAREAAAALKDKFAAHDVRHVRLWTSHCHSDVRALYLPAYVFEFAHHGLRCRLLVNGVTGRVGGERLFSPLKAAAMTLAASVPLAQVAAHALHLPPTGSALATAVGAATVLAAVGAYYFPHLAKLRHDLARKIDQHRQQLAVRRG